jgi:hypothetical protein
MLASYACRFVWCSDSFDLARIEISRVLVFGMFATLASLRLRGASEFFALVALLSVCPCGQCLASAGSSGGFFDHVGFFWQSLPRWPFLVALAPFSLSTTPPNVANGVHWPNRTRYFVCSRKCKVFVRFSRLLFYWVPFVVIEGA